MFRSLLAVVAGLITFTVLSFGTDAAVEPGGSGGPGTGLLVLAIVYLSLYALAGGYVTAWVAGEREVAHALVLGLVMAGLGALVALGGQVPEAELLPAWYHAAGIALTVPAATLGGRIRARRTRRA